MSLTQINAEDNGLTEVYAHSGQTTWVTLGRMIFGIKSQVLVPLQLTTSSTLQMSREKVQKTSRHPIAVRRGCSELASAATAPGLVSRS
jgi:hypothetical protein